MSTWRLLFDLSLNLTLAAVPVGAAVIGVRELRGTQVFRSRALTARGVVTREDQRWEVGTVAGNERSRVTYPVLRFVTAQGREVETASFVRSWASDQLHAGTEVDVLYDPEDPARACVDGFAGTGTRRGLSIILGGVGAGVFCILVFGAVALQLVTLLLLAGAAVVVLARPPLWWRAAGALVLRPDLAEMGDAGPYTAERLAAGGLLAFALLSLLWVG